MVDRAVQAFFRTRPIFADAAAGDLARLTRHVRHVQLDPGEFLFHEDDPASFVYVVEEGLLEILHERPGTAERLHVRDVRRGAVVGELAVMRGDARSASVRAVEPSRLVAIPARDFVAYVRATPSAGLRLAEILAERAQPVVVPAGSVRRSGEVWAVERTDAIGPAFVAALARAAQRPEPGSPMLKVWCAAGARVPLGRAYGVRFEPLTEALRPPPGEVEVVLAGREAIRSGLPGDLTALVSSPEMATPATLSLERHVILSPKGATGPRVIRLMPARPHEVAERVVRVLEGRTIGLALGGGGALGLCHLGVLDVLARERIPVDALAGTSAGALMGGLVLVRGLADTLEVAKGFTRPRLFTLVDPSFFVSGLIEGRRILKLFRDLLGETRIEDLPIPFAALALDLETGEERALAGGLLAEALRASVSLPSVFAPFSYEGEEGVVPGGTYIDAGGVNNVPVDVARELGGARIIGVNVINRPKGWTREGPPWRSWSPIVRGKMIAYAQMIGFARNGERQAFTADVPILPDTQEFGFTQFYRAEELMDAGRRAAEELLPQLRSLARSVPKGAAALGRGDRAPKASPVS